MSREKQIEGMAKAVCGNHYNGDCVGGECVCQYECIYAVFANRIYNAGYRKQEWISVDERLPEPNKLVLCLWERIGDGVCYGFARYQRENVWYVSNEGMPRVTHWMPLPVAPKMKGGAE